MITCQYYTVGLADGYPASSLQGLGGFINKECTEAAPVQYAVIAADESGGYNMSTVEKIGIDLYFQLRGAVAETTHAITHSFPFRITTPAHPATHFADRFTNSPKLRIGRMTFKPAFVGG